MTAAVNTLAALGALLAALIARWLLLDDDTLLTDGYPFGEYRPCRPGDCGELRVAGHRILLTRRVPLWLHRSMDN